MNYYLVFVIAFFILIVIYLGLIAFLDLKDTNLYPAIFAIVIL